MHGVWEVALLIAGSRAAILFAVGPNLLLMCNLGWISCAFHRKACPLVFSNDYAQPGGIPHIAVSLVTIHTLPVPMAHAQDTNTRFDVRAIKEWCLVFGTCPRPVI